MKTPKMPTTIRLAGRTFTITIDGDPEYCKHLMGTYYESEGRITLAANMSPDQAKATALHEVVHDIDRQAGSKLGERNVTILSALLFAAFRDNPAFVAWLMS